MTATPAPTARSAPATARLHQPAITLIRSTMAIPVALYLFAAAVGFVAAASITFPTNEASAYYVSVARNLASGHGLFIDAIWSYATPPLVLPRPAFELWQPMASFVGAIPIALFVNSFSVNCGARGPSVR